MRSLRFLLARRWLFFAVAVVVLVAGTWWLGQWQFNRLEDRQQRNAVVRANEDKAPAPVAEVLAVGRDVDESDEWRQVTATGTYDVANTVIVRYRTRDGASGVDVVVPLVTADGTALLVDRGWMPSANNDEVVEPPTPPSGEVTVVGWARADGTGDSTEVHDHATRAVASERIAEVIGHPVYGGFVELKSEDPPASEPLQPVELPELDNGPHFFYGLQWWFFGALAVFGFFYLLYDEWRSSRSPKATAARSEAEARKAARVAQKRAVRDAYQQAREKHKADRS